jgi:fatty acid desaturase
VNAPRQVSDPFLLSAEQRRRFVRENPPRAGIYWADVVLSSAAAWAAFAGLFFVPLGSWAYLGLVVVSTLAFLRAGSFLHELQHRTEAELPGLHIVWNLLIGIPGLVPSLMMYPHASHHRPATFATPDDPEYAPVAAWPRWRLLNSLLAYGAIALFMPVRWGVVSPLSRLHPALRRHAIEELSTADIARGYRRPMPEGDEARRIALQEAGTFLVVWGVLAGTALGFIPWVLHLHRLVVMGAVLVLNQARLLVAHRYDLGGGRVGPREQSLDALTFGGGSLSAVVAPVGFRFHVLHHELPSTPYHALPRIHRELMETLPADHPYRSTVVGGFLPAWRRLWAQAGRNPAWPLPSWGEPAPARTAGSGARTE